MRRSTLLSLTLLAGFVPMTGVSAQNVGVSIGIQLGPVRAVSMYSSQRYGDWRVNYQQWQPTTLYLVDGRYYDRDSRGARPVIVYRRDHDYFLPPTEKAWEGSDKRFNNKHKQKNGNNGLHKGRPK